MLPPTRRSSQWDCTWICFSSRSLSRGSIDRINSIGAMGSPCLTPDCISKRLERRFVIICPEVECRMLRMSVVKETGNPDLIRHVWSHSWDTLSYAFSLSNRSGNASFVELSRWANLSAAWWVDRPLIYPVWCSGKMSGRKGFIREKMIEVKIL